MEKELIDLFMIWWLFGYTCSILFDMIQTISYPKIYNKITFCINAMSETKDLYVFDKYNNKLNYYLNVMRNEKYERRRKEENGKRNFTCRSNGKSQ